MSVGGVDGALRGGGCKLPAHRPAVMHGGKLLKGSRPKPPPLLAAASAANKLSLQPPAAIQVLLIDAVESK